MLAKAVANHTTASFIRVVGSEFVQKYLGEVCTVKMNLSDEVDLEDYVSRPNKISAAEIAAICQEAGLHAVRKNRYVILPKDFEKVTDPMLRSRTRILSSTSDVEEAKEFEHLSSGSDKCLYLMMFCGIKLISSIQTRVG